MSEGEPLATAAAREALADCVEFLTDARRLVVLTGAGISTESGIPDFRGPAGLWAKHPPASYAMFMGDVAARRDYWRLRRELHGRVAAARPNDGHHALVALERRGGLAGIITQNFDGLHQIAGNTPARVIELHGTSREAACQTCGARQPIDAVQARVTAGEDDPRCPCGGYLKAATILFGQRVPDGPLAAALELARTCDCLLVVGSSLRVAPAARLPLVALERHAPLLIINLEPTPLDARADVVLRAPAGQALRQIVTRLGRAPA